MTQPLMIIGIKSSPGCDTQNRQSVAQLKLNSSASHCKHSSSRLLYLQPDTHPENMSPDIVNPIIVIGASKCPAAKVTATSGWMARILSGCICLLPFTVQHLAASDDTSSAELHAGRTKYVCISLSGGGQETCTTALLPKAIHRKGWDPLQ